MNFEGIGGTSCHPSILGLEADQLTPWAMTMSKTGVQMTSVH